MKIKNLKIKIATVFAAATLAFGVGFTPMLASAEEATETPEISTEIPEISNDSEVDEETSVGSETGENTDVSDSVEESDGNMHWDELTDDEKMQIILDVAGKLAEDAGVGSKWSKVVQDLRTAASEKQVTIMTFFSVGEVVVLLGYIIGKWIGKRKKAKQEKELADDVKGIKKNNEQLTNAYNSSAEATEHVAGEVEAENEKLVAIAAAQEGSNRALRYLIQGTGIKTELKDAAYRSLNESDKQLDIVKK